MSTPVAAPAPATPEPSKKPEPKFMLEGRALTQPEYDAEFAKISAAAKNHKPSESAKD
jgi:hypothetical protein